MESPVIWKVAFFLCVPFFLAEANAVSCNSSVELIKSGDLIYRYQDSFISDLVLKYQGDKSYSHVGIAIEEAGQIKVLHSSFEPNKNIDGVTSSAYCDYVGDSIRIEVKRFNKISLVRDRLLRRIKVIGDKKFNRTFNINSKDALYCTQYIWAIYKDLINVDPFEVELSVNKIITVKKLLDSNYFFTVFKQNI